MLTFQEVVRIVLVIVSNKIVVSQSSGL